MAKTRSVFFCTACGHESLRWLGRCPACEAWNTFADAPAAPAGRGTTSSRRGARPATAPVRLADIASSSTVRISSGMPEFDALLGGGIVPGSLILIGGAPGAGKSTLVLQLAARLAGSRDGPIVYVCGEESAAQTKLRADRLGTSGDLLIFAETNLRTILDALEDIGPRVLVIDSIQTMALPDVESFAGSVAQVRDCATALMEFAKRSD